MRTVTPREVLNLPAGTVLEAALEGGTRFRAVLDDDGPDPSSRRYRLLAVAEPGEDWEPTLGGTGLVWPSQAVPREWTVLAGPRVPCWAAGTVLELRSFDHVRRVHHGVRAVILEVVDPDTYTAMHVAQFHEDGPWQVCPPGPPFTIHPHRHPVQDWRVV